MPIQSQEMRRLLGETVSSSGFREFLAAYMKAALASSLDDEGKILDRRYSEKDLAPKLKRQMEKDCRAFLDANEEDIGDKYEAAGIDFWLTRNRHGAGYWDGDWPDEVSKRLTKAAHAMGDVDLYLGDDGKIYGSPS